MRLAGPTIEDDIDEDDFLQELAMSMDNLYRLSNDTTIPSSTECDYSSSMLAGLVDDDPHRLHDTPCSPECDSTERDYSISMLAGLADIILESPVPHASTR